MRKGQLALGVGTIVLVAALYLGGNTVLKKKENSTGVMPSSEISFEYYEQQQVDKLLAAEKMQWDSLMKILKTTNDADTSSRKQALLQLADFWKNLHHPAIDGYYTYLFAQLDGSKTSLVKAADLLIGAYKKGADSIISNNLITFALRSLEEGVQKDSSDVGLQIKLADIYVQGSPEPMKGIGILKALEHKYPDNIPIQIALGRLAIQSGQLDKAKDRFKKVLQSEPQHTEALYFMAITEAQLGHTDEAVRLFEMCKMIVNNKDFSKEIDEIVNNLKSKKI